ncbi:MAG TPA: PQQ-dependent sugar dehydrogenase, partial [bacterium]|nr:PQQ-dependent sugar dehydrogenase [bacterium]
MRAYYHLSLIFLLVTGAVLTAPVEHIRASDVELVPFTSGLSAPTSIQNAGDSRLMIAEKTGRIRIVLDDGTLISTPFLDITDRVGSGGNEQGLLGIAFHPNYSLNGYFYVNYTDTSGDTVVSRFTVTSDPDLADPGSESIILSISQPYTNHNGGDLAFGPDGFLYIATGDGGSGGDPQNYAQNPLSFLGKILRIDVDGMSPYSIPGDNPFVSDPGVLDEIWALGVRNPWRFAFDS